MTIPGDDISDSDDESPVVADEIMIVAEKNLRRFTPVLDRITPAKSKQGFADYVNTKGKNNIANHRKDRRHQVSLFYILHWVLRPASVTGFEVKVVYVTHDLANSN